MCGLVVLRERHGDYGTLASMYVPHKVITRDEVVVRLLAFVDELRMVGSGDVLARLAVQLCLPVEACERSA